MGKMTRNGSASVISYSIQPLMLMKQWKGIELPMGKNLK